MIRIDDEGVPRLVPVAELSGILPGVSTDKATKLVEQATAMIESACSRVLVAQTVTETWRLTGAVNRLRFDRWPVTEIVSVMADSAALAAADYEIDGTFLFRLSDDERIAWCERKVVVQYKAGYAEDGAPADLQRAVLDLCVTLNSVEGRDPTLRSVSIPDVGSESYRDLANGGDALASVASTINAYKEWRV